VEAFNSTDLPLAIGNPAVCLLENFSQIMLVLKRRKVLPESRDEACQSALDARVQRVSILVEQPEISQALHKSPRVLKRLARWGGAAKYTTIRLA
jgi:hypothetical protein